MFAWLRSRPGVFAISMIYLLALFTWGILFFLHRDDWLFWVPSSLGSVPVLVVWFGALGAVIISMTGVLEHSHDWADSYAFWHWSRPFIGASLGLISVLIFQAGILAVGISPTAAPAAGATAAPVTRNLLYYVIAFLVGYREETFRLLAKRVLDVILSPGDSKASPPAVTSIAPSTAPLTGGTESVVTGRGLGAAQSVVFGSTPARFTSKSDSELTVTVPAATTTGPVTVIVSTKAGAVAFHPFTYQ